jgi:hypothetical protein
MLYVKVTNGSIQYPYTIGQLRKDNPNTSFPAYISADTLAAYDVYAIQEVPAPEVDPLTQRHEQTNPIQVDGKWTQTWRVVQLSEDKATVNVRAKRNQLLADSDWTQLADSPVDKDAWAVYREALRTLPEQAGVPYSVQWPVVPNA